MWSSSLDLSPVKVMTTPSRELVQILSTSTRAITTVSSDSAIAPTAISGVYAARGFHLLGHADLVLIWPRNPWRDSLTRFARAAVNNHLAELHSTGFCVYEHLTSLRAIKVSEELTPQKATTHLSNK
ncbi:hypothetical protein J6590_065479 [Homalodisca vitripennis]|nr:hypothetical protein J6590_065479 [Homalodisca vitripennis]